LSSFKPVQVLKNQVLGSGNNRRAMLRKTLTVFQFVIAQIFIIGTLLVGNQISYSLNKDLGFKKDGIVFFSGDYRDTTLSNRLRLIDMIEQMPDVKLAGISNGPPLSTNTWTSTVTFENKGKTIENSVQIKLADTNYLRMYNISLVAGRPLAFSDTMKEYLINETYLHALGFNNPNDILNKQLKYGGQLRPVVGVMRDFHQKSVREKIIPLLISTDRKRSNDFQVALDNTHQSDWKSTIKNIESAFHKVYPDLDFEYKFFDESIEQFYTSEKNTVKLLNWASGLAIFISCLGLLGLVIYITNQRTKEIGIRKVVGANAAQIMVLLSRDFVKLVVIAFLISIPIAWYGTHKWLENFEYRTNISWTLFVSGGLILLGIALLTLSIQVIRSAMANPVESLRNE
ncbi:MAG TPA: FtsX-like permease family protein, partial [Flavitalea sp.]|nr:FtsX-like permease family protein [Flavitalea sp.]